MTTVVVLVAAGAFVIVASGSRGGSAGHTYKVVLDNAFGLTGGADVKVGGVRAGTITGFGLARDHRAVVTMQITESGFGSFRTDATCDTRPQSLIGEYFIDCQPGHARHLLREGGTIPVSHTTSTVGPDLVNDILRLPYRERLRLVIGELGAGVAARGDDLNAALRRAVPALRETDGLLRVLGDESSTINRLTVDANTVVGALAGDRRGVQGFVHYARRAAQASAERRGAIAATFHRLPGFLAQLRPTMADLGRVAERQTPAIRNLAVSAPALQRFLTIVQPFAAASKPALLALGTASVTGRSAVRSATPTIAQLGRFARPTPELANNLSLVLRDLDSRKKAIENDPRAAAQLGTPNAKVGYTGLEDLLMYTYNQSVAANAYDRFGHLLRVDAFTSECGPYYNLAALKAKLKADPAFKHCLSILGPTYPGLNAPDPSDRSLLNSGRADANATRVRKPRRRHRAGHRSHRRGRRAPGGGTGSATPGAAPGTGGGNGSTAPGTTTTPSGPHGPVDLPGLLGRLLGKTTAPLPKAKTTPAAPDAGDLLNYLLAP